MSDIGTDSEEQNHSENLLQCAGVEGHYGRNLPIGGEIPRLSY
jgi:hypothetical protein